MPSAKSIAQIKSALLHPATTSHFEVDVDITKLPSNYLQANGVKYDKDKLNLLCSEAALPGSSLATLEITNDHTGVTERHAYRRIYDDRIDLTFYVDVENYMPIRLFETWIKFIANESKAVDQSVGASLNSAEYNYRFKYRDDYAVDGLRVTKFEKSMMGYSTGKSGNPLSYRFVKAYPISVSSMPIAYDSSSLLKCTVSMTYMRYYIEDMVSNMPTENYNLSPIEQAQWNAPNYLLNPQFGVQGPQGTPRGPNDFLNIGNPALDQFGVRDQFGRGAEGTVGANILA